MELALIILLGAAYGVADLAVAAVAGHRRHFAAIAGIFRRRVFLFVQFRWWLPMVLSVGWRDADATCAAGRRIAWFLKSANKRRVKSVFSKMVSPEVMNELLDAEKLSLGGARREVTVFFADVRGFTTFTDQMQDRWPNTSVNIG